jgi:hypothetical protein
METVVNKKITFDKNLIKNPMRALVEEDVRYGKKKIPGTLVY